MPTETIDTITPMSALRPSDRYKAVRLRIIGRVEWMCPKCSMINKTRLRLGQWRVRCRHNTCHKWFGVGHRIWDLSEWKSHKMLQPDDVVFPLVPADVLPLGQTSINEMLRP